MVPGELNVLLKITRGGINIHIQGWNVTKYSKAVLEYNFDIRVLVLSYFKFLVLYYGGHTD